MFHFSASPPKASNPGSFFRWMSVRAEMALSLIFIIAILQLFTAGLSIRTVILSAGSTVSIAILFGLSRGIRQLLTHLPSYIPYLFGLYLFFIEGFWRMTQLLRNFTIYELMMVFFYLIIGSSISATGYTAIQQAQRMREGH